MNTRNIYTDPTPAEHAYIIAAGFTAALYYGLVPQTIRDGAERLREEIPLFPDDVFRESLMHLAAAPLLYSPAHVSRFIAQAGWSAEIIAARLLMATLLETANVSQWRTRRPRLSEKKKLQCVEQCINAFWPEGQDAPQSQSYVNQVGPTAATDLEELVSRLSLLTRWGAAQLRARIHAAMRAAIDLLDLHWRVVTRLAKRLLEEGHLSDADTARLGREVLGSKLGAGTPLSELMAFHRDQVRAHRHLLDGLCNLLRQHSDSADREGENAVILHQDALLQDLRAAVENAPNCGMICPEPATPAVDLALQSSIFKAGRLLLAVYNGSFIDWSRRWEFKEVMPDSDQAVPVRWLEEPATFMSASHQARMLNQAGWELQGLFAGRAAELIETAGAEADHLHLPCPASELIEGIEKSSALLRVCSLTPWDADQLLSYLKALWTECCSILRAHWSSVTALKQLIEERGTLRLDDVLGVAGDLRAHRFADDPVNELLFRFIRERLAMDALRATEEESEDAENDEDLVD